MRAIVTNSFLRHFDIPGASVATYFLSRMTLVATDSPGMSMWRKKLFVAMARNASDPVTYFGLPDERTVAMGRRVPF